MTYLHEDKNFNDLLEKIHKVEALWGEVTRYFKVVDNRERIYQKMV